MGGIHGGSSLAFVFFLILILLILGMFCGVC